MRFWDSSALVPLIALETASVEVRELRRSDPVLLVWWGTFVECASALSRREREGELESGGGEWRRLEHLNRRWIEIPPSAAVRRDAVRIVRTHAVRAADAFQLAAAIAAAEGNPSSLPLVTLDGRLAEAAEQEGFPVVPGSL